MAFSDKLINWYRHNKRDLPWRNVKDPYIIWLSEIILQQTRVNQGLPYFRQFVGAFPDVFALAAATPQKVLRLWQGLGYYTRARNMHETAQKIAYEYNGHFPQSYHELLKLKGVGKYTAAAIASFSFHEDIAVLDGNVARVIARIYGISEDISDNSGKKLIEKQVNTLLPRGQSPDFNQGMMEFGATFCVPVNPSCENCIFNDICYAYQNQMQHRLPVKAKKAKVKVRYFNYLVFREGDALYLKQRTNNDIWKGLFDFHLIETPKAYSADEVLNHFYKQYPLQQHLPLIYESACYKHQLTHQKILAKFIVLNAEGKHKNIDKLFAEFELFKYTENQLHNLPKPILINKFLNNYYFF